jgi:CDP-diacylglycerol--glycerol-3-phosphate 3-phosphatidyltransferase
MLVFSIASLTDFLDGVIARKNGATDFGRIFDPVADKVLIFPVLLCFLKLSLVGVVPIILLLVREFVMSATRLELSKQNLKIEANVFGKIKTILQIFSIHIIMLHQIFFVSSYLKVSGVLLWLSVFFSWVSFFVVSFRKNIFFKKVYSRYNSETKNLFSSNPKRGFLIIFGVFLFIFLVWR